MNDRLFLDTSIFVSSFDASSPKKAAQARKQIRSSTSFGISNRCEENNGLSEGAFSKPLQVIQNWLRGADFELTIFRL
jgi:hypothetical protein